MGIGLPTLSPPVSELSIPAWLVPLYQSREFRRKGKHKPGAMPLCCEAGSTSSEAENLGTSTLFFLASPPFAVSQSEPTTPQPTAPLATQPL